MPTKSWLLKRAFMPPTYGEKGQKVYLNVLASGIKKLKKMQQTQNGGLSAKPSRR